MTQRRLGPDAPEVGSVGFGGMALSFEERPSERDAIALIHAVLERGVTLIDTADIYAPDERDVGHNERLVAKALREWRPSRDRVVIATKGGYTRQGGQLVPSGRPDHLRQACERSLQALGVDVLDLYQLHILDPAVPLEDSVGALRDLRDEGKVRWIGLSNVTLAAIDAARAIVPIQTVQNEASLFNRDSLREGIIARLEQHGLRRIRQLRRLLGEPFASGVVAHCARFGMALLAYSPFGGTRNRRIARQPTLEQIARAHDASPYAVAIAWLLAQSKAVIPIPSARTIAHAVDALRGAALSLSPEELAAINAATL